MEFIWLQFDLLYRSLKKSTYNMILDSSSAFVYFRKHSGKANS